MDEQNMAFAGNCPKSALDMDRAECQPRAGCQSVAPVASVPAWDEAVVTLRSGDLNAMHRRVWRVLTDGIPNCKERDFLYAPLVDGDDGRVAVLVRSAHLPEHLGGVVRRVMPERGHTSDFRLLLRLEHKSSRTGRSTLYEEVETVEWLSAQFQDHGLALNGEPDLIRSAERLTRHGYNTDIPYWEIYGSLSVKDRDVAAPLILGGLGRLKGFGFGLLMFGAKIGERRGDPGVADRAA